MKIVASQAHKKQLEVGLDVAPNVPAWVLSDPTRIRQCVVNLMNNGVKFTEAGEVVTRVEVESSDAKGVILHFSVRDTGMGIPPEDQARIFEAYTQADGSMTRRFGGTGLGLTITAQIVDALGGGSGWRANRAAVPPSISRCPALRRKRRPVAARRSLPDSACSSWTTMPPTARSCWA